MILVSACLLGMNTKYDGTSNNVELLTKYSHLGRFQHICPEQLGGFSTPRKPAEIRFGDGFDVLVGKGEVRNIAGENITAGFLSGAREVGKLTNLLNISAAILKEKSPSCGSNYIYDGSFNHKVIHGNGVTAALLKSLNIPVYSEKELTEELLLNLLKKDENK